MRIPERAQFFDEPLPTAIAAAVTELSGKSIEFAAWLLSGAFLSPHHVASLLRRGEDQAAYVGLALNRPGLQLKEFLNKAGAYSAVLRAGSLLELKAGQDYSLTELADRAYTVTTNFGLWVVEGLGRLYADCFRGSSSPAGILTSGEALALPVSSLPMMHAGAGLSFASTAFGLTGAGQAASRIPHALEYFLALCGANLRPEHAGAAYESLGLVTRTLYPAMVVPMDRCITARHPELRGYFWHGAGRALYFFPLYFVPGGVSPWVAASHEAVDEFALTNAQAGLAWALTMVNLSCPEIVSGVLGLAPSTPSSSRSQWNGMLSAMVVASFTGAHRSCDGFQATRAGPMFARARALTPLVTQRLAAQGSIGRVFEFQDLANVAALPSLPAHWGGMSRHNSERSN